MKNYLTMATLYLMNVAMIANLNAQEQKTARTDSLFALEVDEVMKIQKAQSDVDKLMNAEVVSATKQAEKLIDASANMVVITQKDIIRYGYTNLYEALARVPEIYVHYHGHNFSADFRGFFTNNIERRVLYLLNGKKMNDMFHFGDFYADIFNDLSNVERIEIIRGPGASLYGNNAVLGVVNIITKDVIEGASSTTIAVNASHLRKQSGVMQYSLNHRKQYGKFGLALDVNWFKGEILYDTKTNWSSTDAQQGRLPVILSTDAYFRTDNSTGQDAFVRGRKLPNFQFQLSSPTFTLGSFLYSRVATWVWPKDTNSFGNPANDRAWGTSGVYLNFHPPKGFLAEKLRLQSSVGYYFSTNREVADFDFETAKARLRNVMFANAWSATPVRGQETWVKDKDGNFYEYVRTEVPRLALTDSAILANGGGARFVYHGLDKVASWDFQINPIQTDKISLMFGGNANYADYNNFQRMTYRNNVFIGWARFGGITDNGYTFGSWGQLIYRPFNNLIITTGVRYDYQKVLEVYRQLGGRLRYDAIRDAAGNIVEYRPTLKENRTAQDITPRICINYHFSPFTNIRLLYGQAFRMVPPQEIIRLPFALGDAQSEKTNNVEAIFTTKILDNIILTANAFWLKGSEIYAWNPTEASFNKATGWENTGGSLSLQYVAKKFEAWTNFTYYDLKRATDAYTFMTTVVDGKNVPLPNQFKPLESPTFLLKGGASYNLSNSTIVATELFYNGEIQTLHPKRNNDELFYLHRVPASFYCNLIINQNLSAIGIKGFYLMFRVENLFDQLVWNVLPSEAENWNAARYEKPHQIPNWGRLFSVRLSANVGGN